MQHCSSQHCDQPRHASQGQQSKYMSMINCPLCKQAQYCSNKCRDFDWPQHKSRCLGSTMSSEASTLKQMRRTPDDFEIVHKGGNLGRGSYGQVKLVKDKSNGLLYAMKIMVKKEIFEYCSVDNLKREIRIQKKLDHPHVTKLFHYFEDKEQVYLILEFAQNGSLFGHLRRCKQFPENEAFVYFFQTCLGIDYLHKNNIIHRDLKPENLLLEEGGNIKICDFGWSAENYGTTQKRTTFCGTIDYMAPEMIENKPHDHTLDIWSLGILLYELVNGTAPYKGRNDIEKCNNIVNQQRIEFNQTLSPDVHLYHQEQSVVASYRTYQNITQMKDYQWHQQLSTPGCQEWLKHTKLIWTPIYMCSPAGKLSQVYLKIKQSINEFPNIKESKKNMNMDYDNSQQSMQSTNANSKDTLSRTVVHSNSINNEQHLMSSNTEDGQNYKGRISKISQRNRQEIQNKYQQKKEVGVFDKFLVSLGCMKRD